MKNMPNNRTVNVKTSILTTWLSDYRDVLAILIAVMPAIDDSKLEPSVRDVLPGVRAELPALNKSLEDLSATVSSMRAK